MKLPQNDLIPWPPWRARRLIEIMRWKAKGLTDEKVAEKMPISQATVSREINSPQARAIGQSLIDKASTIVWPLVERQLAQIEGGGLKPGQQLTYRGQLIKTMTALVPKQLDQRILQKTVLDVEVKHEWNLRDALSEYGSVILEATQTDLDYQNRKQIGADTEQSMVSDEEP